MTGRRGAMIGRRAAMTGRRLGGLGAAALLASLAACGGDDDTDAPATTVTQSGDTTIIVPTLDGPMGRLVSDLIIGADETSEDAIFGWVRDAAFAPGGDIFVADGQSSRVSRFTADGSFSRIASRGGDGPGELDEPIWIAAGPDGQIAVANRYEVEVFDAAGAPAGTIRFDREIRSPLRYTAEGVLHVPTGPVPPGPASAPWRTPGLGIGWSAVVRPRPDTLSVVYLLDARGALVDSIPAPWSVGDFPCIDVEGLPDARVCVGPLYYSLPWFDWLPDGRMIRGHTGPYRLDIESRDGSIVSLRPPRPPTRVGRELDAIVDTVWSEMEGELARYHVAPTHKPAIAGILPAADGRIWVRLHAESESTVEEDGRETWTETESRFDIFTPDGEHQGYVTGPADLRLRDVRGDTVLTTRTGALGVGIVERFVIEWSGGGA